MHCGIVKLSRRFGAQRQKYSRRPRAVHARQGRCKQEHVVATTRHALKAVWSEATKMMIERIDHLVLTVKDVEATLDFYQRVLGMKPERFDGGRRALSF